MTDQSTITGRIVLDLGRGPARFPLGRVCAEPGCDTRLSAYNQNGTCFLHSPARYPRARGRTGWAQQGVVAKE